MSIQAGFTPKRRLFECAFHAPSIRKREIVSVSEQAWWWLPWKHSRSERCFYSQMESKTKTRISKSVNTCSVPLKCRPTQLQRGRGEFSLQPCPFVTAGFTLTKNSRGSSMNSDITRSTLPLKRSGESSLLAIFLEMLFDELPGILLEPKHNSAEQESPLSSLEQFSVSTIDSSIKIRCWSRARGLRESSRRVPSLRSDISGQKIHQRPHLWSNVELPRRPWDSNRSSQLIELTSDD